MHPCEVGVGITMRIDRRFGTIVLGASVVLASGPSGRSGASGSPAEPRRLFDDAARAAQSGARDEALELLASSFAAGHPAPFDVMQRTVFRPLRHDPELRRRLSDLLRATARQSEVTIVTPEQLGERMRIDGRLVERGSGEPVTEALIHVFHTTAEGLYAPESPQGGRLAGNPFLFAWVRPDTDGRFVIHTVRPASYAGFAKPNMRHVHFSVEAAGSATINSQLYLDKDPEPSAERRRRAGEMGWPILSAEPLPDGSYRLELLIEMSPRSER